MTIFEYIGVLLFTMLGLLFARPRPDEDDPKSWQRWTL